ncbi:MAG: acyl carrier protein [Anaerolineaceae bacterium]|nr:acyl carrier protein [Anaerolineaceae bacterium]
MPKSFPELQGTLSTCLSIPIESIQADFQYGDVPEWDSLGHMNLMMALEEKYGIEISTETIAELTSIKAIWEYLEKHAL